MEWQAVVLVMQILMLAVGWFLFQQAKGELSAHAAETPVLGEVKALQRSIKQLLTDMENTSERTSLNLEAKCRQAQELASTLADYIETTEILQHRSRLLRETETAAALPPLTMLTQQGSIANRDPKDSGSAGKLSAVCSSGRGYAWGVACCRFRLGKTPRSSVHSRGCGAVLKRDCARNRHFRRRNRDIAGTSASARVK